MRLKISHGIIHSMVNSNALGGTATLSGSLLNDEELVVNARRGDFGSFEILFERHRTHVYRFVYQIIPRRDDAEDIVQEAFLKAYLNIGRYRSQARFSTWLLRIAANLATDFGRTNTRRLNLEEKEASTGLNWMTIGNPEDPVDSLDQDCMRSAIQHAIAGLPTHQRICVILRDIEFKEYEEIAVIFGCTLGGAKLRVLRARRALRGRLLPLLGDRND